MKKYMFTWDTIDVCEECPLCDACEENYCALTADEVKLSEKPSTCPLEEVSDGN